MQLALMFLDDPAPPTGPWERIEPAARNAATEVLARLLAQAVLAETPEVLHDE